MKVKLSQIKPNNSNPRFIRDEKFKKLVKSIQDFPEMLKLRPIVVNENMVVLGGNMRLKACKEAGLKEVYILKADNLTEQQEKEFIIKDNVGFGQWDWDILSDQWDNEFLNEWGLDIFTPEVDVDYSILDDADLSNELDSMTAGVKKAIQIEFEAEHYEEASELVKYWRNKEAYIGGMFMEYLKAEKHKI